MVDSVYHSSVKNTNTLIHILPYFFILCRHTNMLLYNSSFLIKNMVNLHLDLSVRMRERGEECGLLWGVVCKNANGSYIVGDKKSFNIKL